ncbi:MAG: DNA translocase FtsK 4TM domain-containing protein [Chlamydiota bacterium]|nr:DNA translocase FtsK 4TM domain-containing protein [Chlamydiota bacterium]
MKKSKKKKTHKAKKKPPIKESTQKLQPEVQGFCILTFSIVMMVSLISFAQSPGSTNSLGLIGETIGKIFHSLFGITSYVICVYIGWIGWRKLFSKPINNLTHKTLYIYLLISSLAILLSLFEDRFVHFSDQVGRTFYTTLWNNRMHYHLGGAPFYYLYRDLPGFNLYRVLNTFGVGVIFTSTLIASIMFLTKISPQLILETLQSLYGKLQNFFKLNRPQPSDYQVAIRETDNNSRFVKFRSSHSPENTKQKQIAETDDTIEIQPERNLKERPSVSRKNSELIQPSFPFDFPATEPEEPTPTPPPKEPAKAPEANKETKKVPSKRAKALEAQSIYNGDFTDYKLPKTPMLTEAKKIDQTALKNNLKRQAEVLEETLQSFGIEAKVGQINCGPSINSFEVHPAIGVKVQKIKALENDIALNMEAKSIRIIAPIPGKAAVGIEIPNPQPQEVAFKDMLAAYQKSSKKFHIPILLGKSVTGEYVMSDLTKMPHCIIAGATGSGKSVCINTIVMSILMNAKPDEIKLIMVDPKKVELTPYSRLPHMLAPVITEPQGACAALMWLVKEMESRYEILKLTGVRNIDSFNNRKINKEVEDQLGRDIPEKMQYIVTIIDELADLMMVSSSDIETPIARIAQMARAVGIHLILATQRPSREVITGLIKANFPTRISFKVASRVNSQIILDEVGAETLLGNGDMLFLPPGTSHLSRAQGAFIRDEDINKVVQHICDQAPPNYVIQSFDRMIGFEDLDIGTNTDQEAPRDSLYHDAVNIVTGTGNASTTFLQRKLKIGYARAASLMDELEDHGIVGPAEGSKQRRVLVAEQAMEDTSEPFLGAGTEELEEELKI